jgi:hypothetical protein
MNKKLNEIWWRYYPRNNGQVCFTGSVDCMTNVPIACGQAAMGVVRDHFNRALARIEQRVITPHSEKRSHVSMSEWVRSLAAYQVQIEKDE